MAQATKKSAAAKILSMSAALALVSEKRSQLEGIAALTEVPEVKAFVLSQDERYASDIEYLRKRIVYQAQKVAVEMDVEKFAKFAEGLSKLVS